MPSQRRFKKVLELGFIVGFAILIGLDICVQIDAYFISKPFWKPPLITGLVIAIIFLLIGHVVNQLLILLTAYPQLLIGLVGILLKIVYNRWIRRKKPKYIVMQDACIRGRPLK